MGLLFIRQLMQIIVHQLVLSHQIIQLAGIIIENEGFVLSFLQGLK